MRLTNLWPLVLIVFICMAVACASVRPIDYWSMRSADGSEIRTRFGQSLPDSISVVTSAIFEYGRLRFVGIGYTSVNREDGCYKTVALSPLGSKIFELAGRGDEVTHAVAAEGFQKMPHWPEGIARDVRFAYLDLVPPEDASAYQEGDRVVFVSRRSRREVVYSFDRSTSLLISKELTDGDRVISRCRYAFERLEGKLLSTRTVLENLDGGYTLTVKLKEVRH